VYRVSQFCRALVAWVPKRELSLLSEYLTPPQVALFQRMPRSDQRHGLDVFHALRRKQHRDRDLLAAALLHDVGKSGGQLRLWHRVLIVLISALRPQLLGRLASPPEPALSLALSVVEGKVEGLGGTEEGLASDETYSWRYPFFVHQQHPELGAQLAQAAGCSPTTVELIRRHQRPLSNNPLETRQDELLAALQEADGVN